MDATTSEIPQELHNTAYEALKPVLALIWDKASESVDSDRIKTLEAENERLREDLAELAGLRSTNKALLNQLGELNQQLALARAGVGVEDGETFLKLQQERDAIAHQRDALANEVDTLTQQLNDASSSSTILNNQLESLRQEFQALQQRSQELAITNGLLEPLQEQLAEARATIEALQKQVGSRGQQMTTINSEVFYIDPAIASAIAAERQKLEEEMKRLKSSSQAEIPIEELNLSVKTYNSLKRAQVNFVADLAKYTQADLKEIKNLGEKSADEIVAALAKFGITLADTQ